MDSPPLTRRGPADEEAPKGAQPVVPSLGLAAAFGRVGLDGSSANNDHRTGVGEAGDEDAGESSDATSSSAVSSSELESDWSSSAGEGREAGEGVAPTPSAQRGSRPQGMPALGLGGLALGGGGLSTDSEHPASNAKGQAEGSVPSRQAVQISPPDGPGTPMSEGVTPSTSDPSGWVPGSKLKLTLALPRSPVDRASGGVRGGDDIPESEQMNANVVKVDLVSSGFHLELSSTEDSRTAVAPSVDGTALDTIRARCARSFGIASDDLSFYELRALNADGKSQTPDAQGARHIAVAVKHSTFSLGALEDLLAENKRLAASSERSSGALESLENMMRDQTHTFTRTQLRASELEADARRLKERVRNLETEAEMLRDQLKRSDQLRLQGQKALDELKHEFETLTQDIAASGISANYPKRNQSPRNINQSMRSPRLRPPSAPASSAGFQQLLAPDSRVTHVLDRLCSDEVLTRLEKFLASVSMNEQH